LALLLQPLVVEVKVIVSFRVLFVLVVVESLALLVEVALLPSQGHEWERSLRHPTSLRYPVVEPQPQRLTLVV
jgi:hypothetical protein